jgi:hypothetical protein
MVQLTGTGWGISVIEGGEIQKSRSLVVVGVSVGMLLLGIPNAGFPIVVAAVLVIGNALSRRRKLMTPTDPPGWRMDPDGNYQWWSGSTFTDPPAGETPRKIGPEIEW